MGKCKKKVSAYARLSPYVRGIIFGLFLGGTTLTDIAGEVTKENGDHPCVSSVESTVKMCKAQGGTKWNGVVESSGRGPARKTTDALDGKILKLVTKMRGSAKVTVDYVRKKVPSTRKLSRSTIQRRLSEAGLAWLRRRRKSLVPKAHKQARIAFSDWVLSRTVRTLARWVYTDGTTFYLAQSASEKEHKMRGALGTHVWRMADGSDGLYEDCVGPSSYWKAQGLSVRIWGLLIAGILFVHVLPAGQAMDRYQYAWIVAKCFPRWILKAMGRRAKPLLVQDHEKALWCDEPRQAMKDNGIELLESYPKCSQDLNVIETAWRELRARLADTEPVQMESREDFLKRLRLAVAWVNRNRSDCLGNLCFAQQDRARDVKEQKGGRTKH